MPEIPSNPIPGGSVPGRGAIRPSTLGGGTAGVGGVGASGVGASGAEARPTPRFFGYHSDASILARLAGMGVSPTPGNLRIAQQLLRYNQGLSAETITSLGGLWQQHGGKDVVLLEALVVLQCQDLPVTQANLGAVTQLLAGGPLSHLLARLTMAIKQDPNPKLANMGKKLTAFWQLGHLDQQMAAQMKAFQAQLAGLEAELSRLNWSGLAEETQQELGRLADLLGAHKLLLGQANPAQYLPFFVWRDQQPLPAELIVRQEGGGEAGVNPFVRVTIAVETRHMGRVTVELTMIRDHLGVRFEVVDEKLKKRMDPKLVLLRQKLLASPYLVDILACQATGNARAVSALLPRRRDLKKLSRAHGIL